MSIFTKPMDQYVYDEYMRIKKETGGKDFIKLVLEKLNSEGYGFSGKEQIRDKCRKWAGKHNIKSEEKDFDEQTEEKSTYEEGNDFINIICSSKRMMNKDDIIKQFNIDPEIWEIEKYIVKSSEGYRKDRSVKWKVQDGKVLEGDVNDSGKMLIVPLYSVQVRLIKKKQKFDQPTIDKIFDSIKIKDLSPLKYDYSKNTKYKKAFLIPLSDLHLGMLATKEVCGNEYNLEIAEKLFYEVINKSIEKIKNIELKEIVFVLGNDFLNSDNLSNTTVKGTYQDNSDFWFRLIDKGIELIIKSTNTLLEYAPVKIVTVQSNHDQHSVYGIMKTVESFYKDNKNVTVDISPLPRKYYNFGKSVFGFVHDMQVKQALEIMTVEAKEYWSNCSRFYWMMGHLHKGMEYEKQGMLEIYRLPTISGNSRWANNSNYTQTEKKNQCFLIDEENGIEEVYNIFVG